MSQLKQCRACALNEGRANECPNYKNDIGLCNDYVKPLNNSNGMFRRVFSVKGRICRMEYNLTLLLVIILINIPYVNFIAIPLGIVVLILQFIKRMHDTNTDLSDAFLPYNCMWMKASFISGDEGPNIHGTDPTMTYESQILPEWG